MRRTTSAPGAQTVERPPGALDQQPPGRGDDTPVERMTASAYTIPTDYPESDGTFEWTSTTIVIVEASAGGSSGLGYSYTHEAASVLIERTISHAVLGQDAMNVSAAWDAMVGA